MRVPFITESYLQKNTLSILKKIFPNGIPIPVPIEIIIEMNAKIELVFEEMDERILGFCDISNKAIHINSSLEDPDNLHKMRFTMAHELGHYCLHKNFYDHNTYKINLKRMEIQANLFAANILTPLPILQKKLNEAKSGIDDLTPDDAFEKIVGISNEMSKTFEVSNPVIDIQSKKLENLNML